MFRSGDWTLAAGLLGIALLLALQSTGIAGHFGDVSSIGYVWLVWPLLTVSMLLIVWSVRYAERLTSRRLPGLRLGLTLAVLVVVTVAVLKLHNDEQRCVNKNTMTVVPAADCQNQNAGHEDVWYYGGQGTRAGDTARDGSFTRPPEDSGNGNTSGDGGDGSE